MSVGVTMNSILASINVKSRGNWPNLGRILPNISKFLKILEAWRGKNPANPLVCGLVGHPHGLEGGLHQCHVGVGPQDWPSSPKNVQVLEASRSQSNLVNRPAVDLARVMGRVMGVVLLVVLHVVAGRSVGINRWAI